MSKANEQITDEVLTAYLDGALEASVSAQIDAALAHDDALAARLATLDVPMDQLRDLMAPAVWNAPALPADVLHSPAAFVVPEPANAPSKPLMRRLWVPAAVAASFAAGLFVAPMFAPAPPSAGSPKWVEAVASYQALYVTATLDHATQAPDATAGVLTQASADFDVTLDPAIDIDGLDFKRAQMLGWNGKPLLQIAYLDGDGTPMALCLTRVGAEDRGPKTSVSHDLAGVSWVKNGVGYYLIGGQDIERVETLSQQVITSL